MARIPNLFVPGFQKCGTSSLFEAMAHHPEVSLPERWEDLNRVLFPKEPHFFDQHHDRGIDFYASLFAVEKRYALDATPNYLAARGAMERLASAVTEPRFVVGLRDPVERAESAWNHWNQLAEGDRWMIPRPGGTFRDNIEAEISQRERQDPGSGIFGMGCYYSHLAEAFRLLGRERFHITCCEWLKEDFAREIERIHEFLGLEGGCPEKYHVHRRQKTAPLGEEDRGWLRQLYRDECERLENLLLVELPWNWHRTGNY